MGASGWSVTTNSQPPLPPPCRVGASGWSVTTHWQSTLPGGGRVDWVHYHPGSEPTPTSTTTGGL